MLLKISQWLFLFYIALLPLARPFNFYAYGLQILWVDLIFPLATIFWLAALLRRETSVRFDKLYIFIGIYAAALTLSSVFSTEPNRSFAKLAGEFYLFGLAVLAFNLAEANGYLKKIAWAWLIGSGVTALASLAGFILFFAGFITQENNYFLSHYGSLPSGNYPRIRALFENANMMCNFLNVSLMFALLAAKKGWLKKIFAGIFQTAIWFAGIFTLSAGLGGMLLSYGIWQWAVKKSQFRKLILAAAVPGSLIIFSLTVISPDTANTEQDISLPLTETRIEPSARVLLWQSSLETFLQYPLLGKGTGTDAALVKYETLSGSKQILRDAHNAWLNILAQTGIVGFLAFMLLTAYLISRCSFSPAKPILTSLSCAFAGAFLYQNLFGSYEDARHMWILIGLLPSIIDDR